MTEEIIDGYRVRTYPNGAIEKVLISTDLPPEPEPIRILTKLQFRNRFTMEEKAALYTAAESNVMLRIFLDDLNAAESINLDDPNTSGGVLALESLNIIAEGRATQILSGE